MFSISVPGPPIDRTPRAPLNPFQSNGPDAPAATAFIFGHIFDEFIHEPDAARPPPSSQDPVLPVPVPEDDEERTTAFEIPLNTLLDCLSVFGSASLASSASAKKKKGAGDGHESDGGGAGGRRGRDKGKGRAADVGAGAGGCAKVADSLPYTPDPAPSTSRHNGESMPVLCTPDGCPCRQEAQLRSNGTKRRCWEGGWDG